ncbi:hypothetical protein IUJ34_02455 [Klebsiella pneumoniae subsp. pneumoniae]|uniref:Uncharacterized protein n=1 Tax=Klebsiella pneumoniae subsp. pneumoniae TaxID=72407 RepID=A0A7S9HFC6_KLEPN|nr:hypothetical protein IUJ34_02455 [Klebsiella pneumoniae subsp. pneumoniae]
MHFVDFFCVSAGAVTRVNSVAIESASILATRIIQAAQRSGLTDGASDFHLTDLTVFTNYRLHQREQVLVFSHV